MQIRLIPKVILGLAFVIFGIATFVLVGRSKQEFDNKMQSIRTGKIQPETLTVVRKYHQGGPHTGWLHVVFQNSRQRVVNYVATRNLYDAVNIGSSVRGYYFPDGYLIPQYDPGGAAASAKWLFLGFGVLLGGFVLASTFAQHMRYANAASQIAGGAASTIQATSQ